METAKLVVMALTPISVAIIGVLVTLSARRFERNHWLNQKLVEKRIELLSDAFPKLNDLYCYFQWVGGWASFSPVDILRRKRELDRLFYANQAFFTPQVLAEYTHFMQVLFQTFAAPGVDALLRTARTSIHGDRRSAFPSVWDEKWDLMFADAVDCTRPELIQQQYEALVAQLGAEVGSNQAEASTP